MYSALRSGLMPIFDEALPSVEHPFAQESEARTPEHLALEHLELVHKPLRLPVAPCQGQPGVDGRTVTPYPPRAALHLGQSAVGGVGEPRIEPDGIPLTHEHKKRTSETARRRCRWAHAQQFVQIELFLPVQVRRWSEHEPGRLAYGEHADDRWGGGQHASVQGTFGLWPPPRWFHPPVRHMAAQGAHRSGESTSSEFLAQGRDMLAAGIPALPEVRIERAQECCPSSARPTLGERARLNEGADCRATHAKHPADLPDADTLCMKRHHRLVPLLTPRTTGVLLLLHAR